MDQQRAIELLRKQLYLAIKANGGTVRLPDPSLIWQEPDNWDVFQRTELETCTLILTIKP